MTPIDVEIVSTGSELLQGLYTDRNACSLAQRLDALGFRAIYTHAARDDAAQLETLLREIVGRGARAVVMTGGLGPTEDDVNRDVISRVWQAPTELDPVAERMMRERFEARGITMPEQNIIQAMIPRGATTFYNHNGTAPGFGIPPKGIGRNSKKDLGRDVQATGIPPSQAADVGQPAQPVSSQADALLPAQAIQLALPALVALPGPPGEWMPMWESDAAPWLCAQFPKRPARLVRSYHLVMIPESIVNERLRDLFTADPRVEVTLLAARGHVRLRLIATADSGEAEAGALIEKFAAEALSRLPAEIVLRGQKPEWSVEEELGELLRGSGRRIATAESCTGGMIAARITDVAGASEYFTRGWVVYSNEAKVELLGVRAETIARYGAVSGECVREMAARARELSGADAALAVSGIAGPGGGTPEKPVGTLWLALDSRDRGAVALHRRYTGQRDAVREWACKMGLDLLRRWSASLPWPDETG